MRSQRQQRLTLDDRDYLHSKLEDGMQLYGIGKLTSENTKRGNTEYYREM